jgi:hypothetical protein
MKNKRLLIFLTILTSALTLEASDFKVFPSYLLRAKGEDNAWYSVVGVSNRNPIISTEAGLVETERRWISLKGRTVVNDTWIEVVSTREDNTGGNLIMELQLKSSRALNSPFVILVYDRVDSQGRVQRACKYSAMPDLTGDIQTVRLRFSNSGLPEGARELRFFHSGIEVYERNRTDLKEATPDQAFVLKLSQHVAAAGTGDASPAPFYMPMSPPPAELLPEGSGPVTVKVRMTIASNGRIVDPDFMGEATPELKAHILSTIEEWLFLPSIQRGRIVEKTIVIPLQLR